MNANEISELIKKLNITKNTKTEKALSVIDETAEKLATIMSKKGLQITKGGSSPSTSRTVVRIYLETGYNSHNPRNADYENVIAVWEWETKIKHGTKSISPQSIIQFCNGLLAEVNEYEPK